MGDIANSIRTQASTELRGLTTKDGKPLNLKFQEEFPNLRKTGKLNKEATKEVKDYLNQYKISADKYKATLENMEYFLNTEQLKNPVKD